MKEIFFISPHDTHRRNEIFVQSQKKKKKIMVTKVSGLFFYLYGTYCQKKINLQTKYLYSRILLKLALDLNSNLNCALSNPLYT